MDEATDHPDRPSVATPLGRRLVVAATVASMAIPSLDLAIVVSALVAVGSYAMALRWTVGRNLPRSLRLIRLGLGIFTAGILVRIGESAVNGGELVFPGIADTFTFPAYLVVLVGVGWAVLSRHALAKGVDVVDAAAVSVTVIAIAFSLSGPYLFSAAIPRDEQVLAVAYSVVELAFLAVFIVLLFGPSSSIRSTRWFAVAGFYATLFDTLVNILFRFDQPLVVDQMLRTLAVPIAAYALSTSYDDYADFARPGVRTQRSRWLVYGLCFAALGVLVAADPGLIELTGLAALAIVTTVRLWLSHTLVVRLGNLNSTQQDLAADLADADTAASALQAGLAACERLLPPGVPVALRADSSDTSVGWAVDGELTEVVSSDGLLHIRVGVQLRSHQWAALAQVANVLSFAVLAVDARTARITERVHADWQALSGANNELVFIIDTDGLVATASPNARTVLGTNPVGRLLSALLGEDLSPVLDQAEPEILICDENGRWLSVTAEPTDASDHVVTVRDATDRVRAELVDPVTGLNNMSHFARRENLANVTLLQFRLDHFSRAMDLLGRSGADRLLQVVGDRICEALRSNVDEVWRGDGPTFVAVCRGADRSDEWIAERASTITAPVAVDGTETRIGVTTVVVPITTPTSVDLALNRADITLNSTGRRGVVVRFSPELEAETHRRHRIEEALAAVDDPSTAGFRVHYQPIVAADTERVARLEALMRWEHPTLGRVSPGEFIPAAERTGRVATLDRFVMETACLDLRWLSEIDPDLEMQINLSPVGLTAARIDEIVTWVGANCPTPPHLTVEIIETAIGSEFEALVPALGRLRAAGIGLSVDDYGTAESNFSRLTSLPLSQVKLAGIFASEVAPETVAQLISTIHSMGYECVVENVEELHQAAAMRSSGADFLQGWLYSRDLPAPALAEFLRDALSSIDAK